MNRVSSILLRFFFRYRYVRQILWAGSIVSVCAVLYFGIIRTSNLISVPVGWERSFNLSPAGFVIRDYSLCTNGSFAAVIVESDAAGERGIYSAVSIDGAQNFSPFLRIIQLPSPKNEIRAKSSPHIAVSGGGTLAAVWQEYDDSASLYSLSVSFSRDFGSTWSQPQALHFGTGMEFMPRAYYDERQILHIYYLAPEGSGFNLFHASTADGAVFEKPETVARLASSMKGAFFPSIIYDGKKVYAAWQARGIEREKLTDDIYFSTSGNYGSSWARPVRISSGSAINSSPALTLSKGRVICAFENNERKNWEIRFVMSLDGGDTWDAAPLTVTSTNANCYSPSVAATDSDDIVFFWYDNREGANRIFSRRYGLNDNRFSKELSLSEGADPARFPLSFISGKRAVALWEQRGRLRGKFSDISTITPKLRSFTHPDGVWTKNAEAVVEWETPYDESGVSGYASILSRDPDTNPTVQNLNANTRMERIRSLGDGITWYHIRTIDGAGNYSRAIHYPLKVSRTPLPMPVVESPTHPEGKSVQSNAPVLKWQVTDIDRVKGFLYSLTMNAPSRPNNFTESLGLSFGGLDEGRYFFRIQAVDKTNTPGRSTDYEFIVGKADVIDYTKIVQGDEGGNEEPVKIKPPVVWTPPSCRIVSPADGSTAGDRSVSVSLAVSAGRSVVFNSFEYELWKDGVSVGKGSSGSERIYLRDLADGSYRIAVRGRYTVRVNGRKVQGTTSRAALNFSVRVLPLQTPIMIFGHMVSDTMEKHFLPLLLVLFAGGGSLLIKGNLRLLFSLKGLSYRISTRIRLVFSSVR